MSLEKGTGNFFPNSGEKVASPLRKSLDSRFSRE
jgi:hypothetical protein